MIEDIARISKMVRVQITQRGTGDGSTSGTPENQRGNDSTNSNTGQRFLSISIESRWLSEKWAFDTAKCQIIQRF